MVAIESHKQSHVRGSVETGWLAAVAWTALPASVALAAGIWLGWQAAGSQGDRIELARIQEIGAQGRLASEGLSNSIESLRARAIALQQLRAAGITQAVPSSPLLHWAELETDSRGGTVRAVKQHLTGASDAIDWRG